MGSFKTGFGRQLGRLGANAVGNRIAESLGLDQSEHRTYHRGKEKAEEHKQDLEDAAMLNSIDAAVINNIDEIRDIVFADDKKTLLNQLESLEVQLASESWKHIFDAENRVRNKYTDALFSKFCKGISRLDRIDPLAEGIVHLKWKRYSSRWRKIIGKSGLFIILYAIVFGGLAFCAIYEWYRRLSTTYIVLFWIGVIVYTLLRIYITYFRQINRLIKEKRQKPEKA